MRKLWTEPVVNVQGSYHRLDRAGLNPLLYFPFTEGPCAERDAASVSESGMLWANLNMTWIVDPLAFHPFLPQGRSGDAVVSTTTHL